MNSTIPPPNLSRRISSCWLFCGAIPQVHRRILEMTRRLESEGAQLDAHQIEDLLVEELRALGHATLSDWAAAQEEHCYQQAKAKSGRLLHGKKNSTGKAPSDGSKSSSAP